MESKAKLLGHPVHPMLIPFPIGLWLTAFVFDLIGQGRGDPLWSTMAFWMIIAGIIGALAAAIFGLIDWLAIPNNTRAKRIGLLHAIGNVIALGLFVAACALRWAMPGAPDTLVLVLEAIAIANLAVTGWLGGELVDRLGVGVDPNADLNAPSSLRTPTRPAATTAPPPYAAHPRPH